ncbi:MAG: hypothetical protein E7113_04700 [Bacteroidales bacterium]|nr:hypothetical protein [Bacteroidales bacterium]
MGRTCSRGLSNLEFISKLKDSQFLKAVRNDCNLVVGIRNEYINIYRNCDSLAKIDLKNGELQAFVDGYYTGKTGMQTFNEDQWTLNLDILVNKSDLRKTDEKKAQSQLFINNNQNPDASYFCVDLEYTRKNENWRFDIIAIEKAVPHNVALIELKYGSKAVSGKSGIRKHVKDYYSFHKEGSYSSLKTELIDIIKSLSSIGVNVPKEIHDLKIEDLATAPSYYFITLNNKGETEKHSTPQMTMSGYLFKDKIWNCRKVSNLIATEGDCYALINNDRTFNPIFLFSDLDLDNMNMIDDIVKSEAYQFRSTLWEPQINSADK